MPRRDSIQSNKGCFTVKRGRTTIAVIQNDNRIKKRPKNQGRSIKFLRICLIFFYGQFFATAIYTHLIHNIGLVLKKPDDFYPSLKIALGLFMIIHTLFAVVFIWKKKWKLISGFRRKRKKSLQLKKTFLSSNLENYLRDKLESER